jgi:hypothetical protein
MNSFLAREDAMITETYQDETGASATVMGNSRVPFEGDLQFVLSRNGTILYDTKKETPVLLADDDETVEISWNKTLVPGLYLLRTVLIDSGGNVLDLAENVIEAEPIVRINSTETKKESPASFVSNLAALLAAAVFCRRKISVLSRTRSFGEEGN